MADVVDLSELGNKDEIDRLILSAQEGGIEHLSVKVPTSKKDLANLFLGSGFYLVDTQVEYEHALNHIRRASITDGLSVRPMATNDLNTLIDIAGSSFTSTRWHSDPYLNGSICDDYYKQWVISCVNGYAKEILVGEYYGVPVSFLTLRTSCSDCRIDLTAVDKSYRGRGFYRTMVNRSLIWATEEGYSRMLATTQINNLGSRRTWASEGFKPGESWYVLHANISNAG